MQIMHSLFFILEPTPPTYHHCESTRQFKACYVLLVFISAAFFFPFLDICNMWPLCVLCFRQCHLLRRVCPVRKLFYKCQYDLFTV